MSYRKARTEHSEITVWLTYSTYQNPAEKKKIYHTATVSINYTTVLQTKVADSNESSILYPVHFCKIFMGYELIKECRVFHDLWTLLQEVIS